MRLKLDTVAGAEADIDNGGGSISQVSRGAMALDLDTSNPTEVILRALSHPNMPPRDSILSPNYPQFTLKRYAVRAIRGRIAVLRLIYRTPELGAPDETFAAEDVTTLSTGSTQLLPVTLEELRVSFEKNTTGPTITGLDNGETATLNYPVPLRSLVLSGMFSTPPDIAMLAGIRTVNNGTWMGLPKGFWLYTGIRVQYDNSTHKYRVTATVTSKVVEDWSSYAAVRNPADGKYARVPSTVTGLLRAQNYEFGIRWQTYGLLKAGLFGTSNFPGIFGTILDRA